MTAVTELDLPAIDLSSEDFAGDRYHQLLAEVRGQGWLASSPVAFVVLDREAGEFFLRARETAFPGREIADLFGVTAGPLREQIDANILNQQGERHRRLRALVGPAFTPARRGPVAAGHARLPRPAVGPDSPGDVLRLRRRAGQALPVADDRRRARRPGPRRAAAARVVQPGAAAVRHQGAGQPGARDRARRRGAPGLRGGAAGPPPGRAGR